MESETLTAQAAEQQRRAEEDFQARVLAAGKRVQREDGVILTPRHQRYVTDADGSPAAASQPNQRVLPPYQPDPEDERIIIDLDIEEVDDREIILVSKVRQFDGTKQQVETVVHVPAPRMENAFMISRYQTLIQKANKRLENAADDNIALNVNKDIIALYKKLVKMIVPDIDQNLLATINLRALNEVVSVAESMVQQSMSASVNPISYMRYIYRLMQSPNGDNDRGMMKWMREHFKDIEEVYGDADLPNG